MSAAVRTEAHRTLQVGAATIAKHVLTSGEGIYGGGGEFVSAGFAARRCLPVREFLFFDLRLVEFNAVAGAGGQREMGLHGSGRDLLEVVIRLHFENQILGHGTDRGGLAGDQVQGRMQAVSMRNDGDIEERGDGACLLSTSDAADEEDSID